MPPVHLVELTCIQPKLYIGNFQAMAAFTKSRRHRPFTIIAFVQQGQQLHVETHHLQYFIPIRFNDDRAMTKATFETMVQETVALIDYHLKQGQEVLLTCERGVNKSTAMAIAYGIVKRGLSYHYLLEQVDLYKTSVSTTCNHLTNSRFRVLLHGLAARFNPTL